MGIRISTLEDAGILEVVYSPDPVTPEALEEQRTLVAQALAQTNIRRVLLDATSLARFPGILTSLEHNESVSANPLLRKTRFAVVCSSLGPDEHGLETTGLNRGVDIKCFTSREDALAWLQR
ncbi:MAG: hypothetical protein GF346_06185 [Candidatus Eisenbacteria bacterium]|nr:hypothetical protein [Candidatus Latescibacterota bacterium]MBD3302014.1 hypothetical protein [Candidatus Eisenbacteria bacterium]